jgi:hypothetical protein
MSTKQATMGKQHRQHEQASTLSTIFLLYEHLYVPRRPLFPQNFIAEVKRAARQRQTIAFGFTDCTYMLIDAPICLACPEAWKGQPIGCTFLIEVDSGVAGPV